jgi:hypothetical protein
MSSVLTQTVKKATPKIALASSLNPSTVGAAVVFTATLTGPGATSGSDVTFLDGETSLGTVKPAGGAAKFTTKALKAGSHPITASYARDANYTAATSGVLKQMVN